MDNNNKNQIILTESNVLDIYKQLTGYSDKVLSDEEIQKVKERFNELVASKLKQLYISFYYINYCDN